MHMIKWKIFLKDKWNTGKEQNAKIYRLYRYEMIIISSPEFPPPRNTLLFSSLLSLALLRTRMRVQKVEEPKLRLIPKYNYNLSETGEIKLFSETIKIILGYNFRRKFKPNWAQIIKGHISAKMEKSVKTVYLWPPAYPPAGPISLGRVAQSVCHTAISSSWTEIVPAYEQRSKVKMIHARDSGIRGPDSRENRTTIIEARESIGNPKPSFNQLCSTCRSKLGIWWGSWIQ